MYYQEIFAVIFSLSVFFSSDDGVDAFANDENHISVFDIDVLFTWLTNPVPLN